MKKIKSNVTKKQPAGANNFVKAIGLLISLVLVISISGSVFAWVSKDSDLYAELKQSYKLSDDDIIELTAISELSDEKTHQFIAESYLELESWSAVRAKYGVSDDEYAAWQEKQAYLDNLFDIPTYIYTEMKKQGMNEDEQKLFIINASNAQIDIEYAWAEHKKGRTIDDLFEEQVQADKAESDFITAFVMGDADISTYNTKLSRTSDTKMSELLEYAVTLRKEVRDRHIARSGITEAEMELCRNSGMTNIMEMCQTKYISTGNNFNFQAVLQTRLATNDWDEVISTLKNIPLADVKAETERLRREN